MSIHFSPGLRIEQLERSLKEHRDWHAHLEKNLDDWAKTINEFTDTIGMLTELVQKHDEDLKNLNNQWLQSMRKQSETNKHFANEIIELQQQLAAKER
jgi:septal ring factor EnvC (AmiA/AmiB activator)